MTFSTLMVHLDLEHSNDARLRIAGDLAEHFDAKLIGIAAATRNRRTMQMALWLKASSSANAPKSGDRRAVSVEPCSNAREAPADRGTGAGASIVGTATQKTHATPSKTRTLRTIPATVCFRYDLGRGRKADIW